MGRHFLHVALHFSVFVVFKVAGVEQRQQRISAHKRKIFSIITLFIHLETESPLIVCQR